MFNLRFKNKILEDLKSGIQIRDCGIWTIFDSIKVVEPNCSVRAQFEEYLGTPVGGGVRGT